MLHSYNIFLLSLFFISILSNDIQKPYSNRTIASSRSIYELVQARRAASRLATLANKIHRNNKFSSMATSRSSMASANDAHRRFLMSRLKTIIFVSSIPVVFMIIIVIGCIINRYCQGKQTICSERIYQTKPLISSRQTNRNRRSDDTRNFSRKPRILPTNV